MIRRRQEGMTLIELLIALTVLTIGMAGIIIMITIAMTNNARNRGDTNSTMVAQAVLSEIATIRGGGACATSITDCSNTPRPITCSVGGPGLNANGQIDFTAAQMPGYSMLYTSCGTTGGTAGNTQVVYDVRWNVVNRNIYTSEVTVAARVAHTSGTAQEALRYSPPVTLRTVIGQ